eukprot:s126_g8.t1
MDLERDFNVSIASPECPSKSSFKRSITALKSSLMLKDIRTTETSQSVPRNCLVMWQLPLLRAAVVQESVLGHVEAPKPQTSPTTPSASPDVFDTTGDNISAVISLDPPGSSGSH